MDEAGAPGLLESISRYRWMVLLIMVVAIALSTAVGLFLAPRAIAQATIGLTTPSSTNILVQGPQSDASLSRFASQRALFATSDEVLSIAAGRLPNTSVYDLQKSVTVTPSATSTSMVVQATGDTPDAAVATVDAVVNAYRTQTTKQVASLTTTALNSIESNITAIQDGLKGKPSLAQQQAAATTLSSLTQKASDLQTDSAVFGDGVQFVQAASVDSTISHRLPYTAMAVGALVGLALGATIAWLRADRNRRVSVAESVEPILSAPLLGEIVRLPHPVRTMADRMDVATSAREMVVPLLSSTAPGVILVTGAQRRVGATTTAFGLATAAAAEGLSVLIIDADPSTRGLAKALDLPSDARGLIEAATSADGAGLETTWEVDVGLSLKVSVMASGRFVDGEPAVTSAGVRSLLERLRRRYEVIVVDAPMPGSEYLSSVIAHIADETVVVVPRNAAVQPLVELRRHLDLGRARIVGYIYTILKPSRRTTA